MGTASDPASAPGLEAIMDGIANILAIMSSEENHTCTTAEVDTLKLCFHTMKKMKTELDEYLHIVDAMRGSIEHLFLRCEELDKELEDVKTVNAVLLEGQEAVKEPGNTALQEDDTIARQLQDEENKQEQSMKEGERLSEAAAKLLDQDNHTVAKRVYPKRTRVPRQQSITTQESSVSNNKQTEKPTKKRRRSPDTDGSDSVQMDVRNEDEDGPPPKDPDDTIIID